MKLITLNIWGGHVNAPLLAFIKEHADVDIFCFQEVYHNAQSKVSTDDRLVHLSIFSDFEALLPNHRGLFRPVVGEGYGISCFVKKDIEVVNDGEMEVYNNPYYCGMGPSHSRIIQWITCKVMGQTYAVMNFHGLWNGQGKADAPERLMQSQKIMEFMDGITVPKILCGDFNLRPDTQSLQMLEEKMHNLNRSHNVQSTRSSYYTKEEKFADYILTSPEVVVNAFGVLEKEVSDHYPLYLDFTLASYL